MSAKRKQPRFRVGQVVVWKDADVSDHPLKLTSRYLTYAGLWRYRAFNYSIGGIAENDLRPLTRRERGPLQEKRGRRC